MNLIEVYKVKLSIQCDFYKWCFCFSLLGQHINSSFINSLINSNIVFKYICTYNLGRERTFDCKLSWYQHNYYNIIILIGSKNQIIQHWFNIVQIFQPIIYRRVNIVLRHQECMSINFFMVLSLKIPEIIYMKKYN